MTNEFQHVVFGATGVRAYLLTAAQLTPIILLAANVSLLICGKRRKMKRASVQPIAILLIVISITAFAFVSMVTISEYFHALSMSKAYVDSGLVSGMMECTIQNQLALLAMTALPLFVGIIGAKYLRRTTAQPAAGDYRLEDKAKSQR